MGSGGCTYALILPLPQPGGAVGPVKLSAVHPAAEVVERNVLLHQLQDVLVGVGHHHVLGLHGGSAGG